MTDQFNPLQTISLFFMLGLMPLAVAMTTSFTKFSIVLTLLRSALGVQQAPSNLVISGLALAATLVVMAPTISKIEAALDNGDGAMPRATELLQAVRGPLGDFMLKHSRADERQFLVGAAKRIDPEREARETDMQLLIPAFLISEISSGFEAGFLLYIAFLVVDLVVANVLSAMGMMMLSPSTVSIPLKLFIFVSVSGMSKLMHGLIVSYVK
ncbi:type III secretion apparatus protein, YscR/HrcR family [Burkholderia sp. Ch1-1]|uniref:Hypersensitivity response secretion protein HrcR, type III secretion system n=1 Tax=Paraburkholderia dioscoreae TaxID=2604047 RepID=A0A5Q4Z663_9BURK|nr:MULTISPECIES: type III secretion system export apparatus subunit SctR [Paraburkholderia]EIF32300.1 type III secretion apparatus protein, YscR/HrcR family [Burkholderia sp. Ch1-1]MDR8402046.1 type III secretion system export apparatus subunit SctR [Paraburkholderia sp. USG1]VVD27877.1 Putative hypersensitivity response secretion protein HrcR, type III secretion system [Paraburkholderia dioscoreae]